MIRILVIEDEKRVADLLKIGLEENGYQAVVAYDGEMGLRLFQSDSFHMIISDIILPRLNGFELCREIRKADAQIPILMLTALGAADDKLEGFDMGADDYMVKPFDFRELLARVKVLLRRHTSSNIDVIKELSYADLKINLDRQEVARGGVPVRLSPKDFSCIWSRMPREWSAALKLQRRYGIPISIPVRISSMCISITCARKWIRNLT